MLHALITSGYRWADLDEMTEEDLYDLVNAKAKKKEATKQARLKQDRDLQNVPLDNSLEALLRNSGIL